jgi:hypothetical protein
MKWGGTGLPVMGEVVGGGGIGACACLLSLIQASERREEEEEETTSDRISRLKEPVILQLAHRLALGLRTKLK